MSHLLEPSMLGVFILGILTGWLLEWIFVQLFVPDPKQKLERTLQASRQELANLQKKNNELHTSLMAAKAAMSQTITPPASAPQSAAAVDAPPESSQPLSTVAPAAVTKETIEEAVSAAVVSAADDLTRLTGIGPKLAEAMNAAGIKQYRQLAAMPVDVLHACLASSGIRYSKAVAETWAEQAKLAAAADWDGLKHYQVKLKSA
ncbi:MAG: helix-hairpin-helix domain-containing protein [Thiothrix sp.]